MIFTLAHLPPAATNVATEGRLLANMGTSAFNNSINRAGRGASAGIDTIKEYACKAKEHTWPGIKNIFHNTHQKIGGVMGWGALAGAVAAGPVGGLAMAAPALGLPAAVGTLGLPAALAVGATSGAVAGWGARHLGRMWSEPPAGSEAENLTTEEKEQKMVQQNALKMQKLRAGQMSWNPVRRTIANFQLPPEEKSALKEAKAQERAATMKAKVEAAKAKAENIKTKADAKSAAQALRMDKIKLRMEAEQLRIAKAKAEQEAKLHSQKLKSERAKTKQEIQAAKAKAKQDLAKEKAQAKREARQDKHLNKQRKIALKAQKQQIKAQNGGGIISRTLAAPFRYMGGIVGALGGGALTATADTVRNSLRLGPGILGDVLRLGARNTYLAIAGSIRGAVGNILRIPAVFLPGLRGYASDMRRNATSNFSEMLDNFKTPRVVMDQIKSMAYAALGAGAGYIGAHGELLRPVSPSMANALQYYRNGIVNSLASPTPVKPSAASEKEGSRLSSAQTWLLNQSQTPVPSSQAPALTMHPAAGAAATQAPPVPTVPHELTMTPGGGRANGTSSGADQLGMQPARGTQRPDQQAA